MVQDCKAAAFWDNGQEQADGHADAAQALEGSRGKRLKYQYGKPESPAHPVVILEDLGIEVKNILPVNVCIIQGKHFVHVDFAVDAVGGVHFIVFPAGKYPFG